MKRQIPRRAVLTAGPLALVSCANGDEYFGRPQPRRNQRLVFQISADPETLDPAKTQSGSEEFILPSLFEGLVTVHPTTLEPLAGIATHYEVNSDHTRFTFYLRGNQKPRGIRLPNGGRKSMPACWSNGTAITAHDFVYSWRRVVDPNTGAILAGYLYCIRNAEQINAGKHPVNGLAVQALDDFTLQVQMRAPTPYFLLLQDIFPFYVVPRQAIEAAAERGNEASWIEPQHIVASGAFTVAERKANEYICLRRNPYHYDAGSVALEQVTLLSINNAAANINLYKSGECDWLPGPLVSPVFHSLLSRKKDFHASAGFWCMFYSLNTRVPPFDNILARYALNMATDKEAIARFLGAGRTPASSLMPSFEGYPPVRSLPIEIGGSVVDVLAHNPSGARELLKSTGIGSPRIEILYPNRPATQNLPDILRHQWRNAIGAEVMLSAQEEKVWLQRRSALEYKGVCESGWIGDYLDPNTFLEGFVSGPNFIGTGWSDSRYDAMVAEANAAPSSERMRKLAESERHLLRAMPILPLYHNVLSYLQKPYVRGWDPRRIGLVRFKYAWIDTKWRPS